MLYFICYQITNERIATQSMLLVTINERRKNQCLSLMILTWMLKQQQVVLIPHSRRLQAMHCAHQERAMMIVSLRHGCAPMLVLQKHALHVHKMKKGGLLRYAQI